MNKFALILISLCFFGCKKNVTEKHIIGTYQLVSIKKALSDNVIPSPHLNAIFSFNGNNVANYTQNGSFFNGYYQFISKPINYNSESNISTQTEKGLLINIKNNLGNVLVNWEIYNLRFANDRNEIKGYILDNNKYYYLIFKKK
jgi:hypothetical protein